MKLYMRMRLFSLVLLFGLTMVLFGTGCRSGQIKDSGSDALDPFPREILNHKIFKVFRNENRLGWNFRDERKQLFGDKFWEGQESASRGEDKVITYSREQAAALSSRFPAIGAVNLTGAVSNIKGFRVILKGLKIHELKKPFINPEYSGEPDVKTSDFIISMLSAKRIIIQVYDERGMSIGGGVSFVFTGDVKFSKKQMGAVAAENVFIGYILTKPTRRDIARRPRDTMIHKKGPDLIKLAIFHLEDRTYDSKLSWLPTSLQDKLEEAFQRLPQFYIITSRKEDARYKLKGVIRKIGRHAEISLTLYDSLKNEQLNKLSTLVKIDSVDKLYQYQLKVIREFIKPFGVQIEKKQQRSIKQALELGNNIDLVKLTSNGWREYNNQRYRNAEQIGKNVLSSNPDYTDALNLMARTLHKLGKYDDAIRHAERMGRVARRKNDQILLAKAYNRIGNIYRYKRQYYKAINYLKKAARIRKNELGAKHKLTIYSNQGLALAYSKVNRTGEAIRIYQESIKQLKKIFGEEHKTIGTTYLSIGAIYSRAKQYDKSLDYLFKALKIQKKHLKSTHPDIANSYRWIGTTYYYLKNYRSAERYYLDAMRIYKKLFGENHPDTKGTYSWLASIYRKMKNYNMESYYKSKSK